uniref:hypothetical protein n=1 Tax=Roseivirga sp. TaxID=1964215 RepID=UPI004048B977
MNKFKTPDKQTLELADSFVLLSDFLFIFQVKDRQDSTGGTEEDWFKNKILKTAVKQIKNSLSYLNEYDEIPVTNQRGHKINVAAARELKPQKIIVYNPNENLPERLRFQKFHESKSCGLIHLFHTEDYYWICKFLITPYEIDEYLTFRERLYSRFSGELNHLPEQYVLGHYLESIETDHLNPAYVENVKNLQVNIDEFDISFVIENFNNKIIQNPESRDYYLILQELAKLNRSDLKQFKLRYTRAIEKAKENKWVVPYRIVSLNSKCGFAFIPLEYQCKDKWMNALTNYVEAHKYDQRLDKCIGMIVYYEPTGKYYDVNWTLREFPWEHDDEYAKLIEEKIPLREVKTAQDFRYYVKK